MQEAGANQALELAFTLADGKEYVRPPSPGGMDVDDFAGRLSFFWAIGMNFYLESPRCAPRACLWCRIMKGFQRQEPEEPDAAHALPDLGWSLTEQDPYNNVVRTTIEAMAAVFRRHAVAAHQRADEAIALPTEFFAPALPATRSSSSRKKPTSPTWSTPGPVPT